MWQLTPTSVASGQSRMRSFDPRRVARLECAAWVAYYRHQWARVLIASLGLVHESFSLPTVDTVRGGWLVLRANQVWAPYPDNDAAGAEQRMRQFYALVKRHHRESFDVNTAARLEIGWWRVHRELQHERHGQNNSALVDALQRLYAHLYGVHPHAVRSAAYARATAMDASDLWVASGCDPKSPLIGQIYNALLRSYRELSLAVR